VSLSTRAESYLATLRRGEHLSATQLAEALCAGGYPLVKEWLDFQSRYAGYEEIIGRERAVWGIVHADATWLEPYEVVAEQEDRQWHVMCADVHPSYDYWLDAKGQFVGVGGGGQCESFDVKVERDSIFWSVTASNGRRWEIDFDVVEKAGELDVLLEAVGARAVSEASDKYATLWQANDVIVLERGGNVTAWTAVDSRQRIADAILEGRR
jgi:hypothetical protein